MDTLRITSLNCQNGEHPDELVEFFSEYSPHTDVFLAQEMSLRRTLTGADEHNAFWTPFDGINAALRREFTGYFVPNPARPTGISQALFIRKTLPARRTQDTFTWEENGQQKARLLQMALVGDPGGTQLLIANYHGLWSPEGKRDNPNRIRQSEWLAERVLHVAGSNASVLMGDMNFDPDTQAHALLNEHWRCLISAYGYTNTRTPLYREWHNPDASKFADYAFTSDGLVVQRFAVTQNEASDHAALQLTVRLP